MQHAEWRISESDTGLETKNTANTASNYSMTVIQDAFNSFLTLHTINL